MTVELTMSTTHSMEPTHTNGTDSVFAWEGVKYGVKKGKRAKEILKGLQGSLSGGEVCAILGPSGAGKSSLLNVLAGRIRHKGEGQRVAGTITLDGKSVTGSGELRKRIAYVMQEDLLFATQTPREALMFSAKLRLPRAMSNQEKVERVESMLTDLGLLDCANTFIGDDRKARHRPPRSHMEPMALAPAAGAPFPGADRRVAPTRPHPPLTPFRRPPLPRPRLRGSAPSRHSHPRYQRRREEAHLDRRRARDEPEPHLSR